MWIYRCGIITHDKRCKDHSRAVTRVALEVILTGWCPVILYLYSLIGYVTSRSCYRVRCILYSRFLSIYWENTDKEVVVDDKSISLVMSIVSITPAALTVTSY
jgi:hypothetical protein